MARRLARNLLPVLFLALGIYVLLQASGPRPLLAYFISAVLIGMGLAAAQWAWRGRDEE